MNTTISLILSAECFNYPFYQSDPSDSQALQYIVIYIYIYIYMYIYITTPESQIGQTVSKA